MIDWQWIGVHEPPKDLWLLIWNCEYDEPGIARWDGITWKNNFGFPYLNSEISHWALPKKPTVFK